MPALQTVAFTANIKQRLDSDQVEDLSAEIAKYQQASASNRSNSAEGKKEGTIRSSWCSIFLSNNYRHYQC